MPDVARPGSSGSRSAWDNGPGSNDQQLGTPDPEALYGSMGDPHEEMPPGAMATLKRPNDLGEEDVEPEPERGCWYSFRRGVRGMWATRMTENTKTDREMYVRTTLRELIIYLVFLVILSVLTFGMTSSSMFYYTQAMTNLFVNSLFPDTRNNFRGMNHPLDFWRFTQNPMLDGLYWEKWYNDDTIDDIGYIFFENKMLGVPRLRHLKVRNDSCTVHEDFNSEIPYCYDVYSRSNEDKENFGPMTGINNPENPIPKNETPYVYQSEEKLGGSSHWGLVSTYGGGGFIQLLGTRRNDTEVILTDLKNSLWIDRGTRVVFLDFTVYNANINLFCVVKLTMEFPATGGIIPSWSFRTVKLIRYVSIMDYFVLACELIFCLFILYYTIEELIEIYKHGCKYLKSFWNLLDLTVIGISYTCIAFSVYRLMAVTSALDELLSDVYKFQDFEHLGFWQTQYINAVAVAVFFAWIKTFKYISFNKTMTQLSSTLSRCAKDIGGFGIMFCIIFFAFAQLGYLIFGTQVRDFSKFSHAVFTLLRIILGDFDFHELERANRILGPIYFCSYVFFVFFVLLNMFLAIINDTYAEVKAEIAQQTNEFEISDYFKKGYKRMMNKMTSKRDRIIDIQKALAKADMNDDHILDFDEWRQEMKARGYADAEIETVFAKYDLDGDRQLSQVEQQQMISDLERQKDDLENEMTDAIKKEKENPDKENEMGFDEGDDRRVDTGVKMEEFDMLGRRVDRVEHSIGSIVSKIDAVLVKLEAMEKAKARHKEKMGKMLSEINQDNSKSDKEKREQMERMVRDEMDKWDTESTNSGASSSGVSSTSGGRRKKT